MLSDRSSTFGPAREDDGATPDPFGIERAAVPSEEPGLLGGTGFWLLGGASLLAWTAISLLLTSA